MRFTVVAIFVVSCLVISQALALIRETTSKDDE